jgi:ABC-type dipeptide/oligopeptide/nickel transport system ATPase component
VCDEPVSALDLSTQARVLDLLVEIQERTGVALLVITHDLSVVRAVCHRVAVMYQGVIVEQGDTAEIINAPNHNYTKKLLLAAPVSDPDEQRERREARRRLSENLLTQPEGTVSA